ncbi:BTAD domain-containing putative transcriptional regulator [Kibdelosporangium persicum]|uniref:DNA-binding SARP family transcriptional activator n=1 Tax=Kibdelosporangium persicum TaxID=2698649 RepID=A0ABX2F2V0_9PSEU|nr:BTAD domain-containing putative transcriptional regulator [Kibdelosporangium persicum]NRN65330.1 DNA-binding SARP family transcriptional activator [Kibdelosporangium persicum]
MTVEFRVLGTVEAIRDGEPVNIGHARQRSVLAVLVAHVGQPVTADQLVERVWADRAPQRPRDTLYSYLSKLRQVLADVEGVAIERDSGAYRLVADPLAVDVHRFEDLVARARAEHDPERSLALFDEALGLWRGEAFAGMDTPWFVERREALQALRDSARSDRVDRALQVGRHHEVITELTARSTEQPMDERVTGQLMLALHRSGRTAEALTRYDHLRRTLIAELGTDPGVRLQQLHAELLASAPPPAVGPPPRTRVPWWRRRIPVLAACAAVAVPLFFVVTNSAKSNNSGGPATTRPAFSRAPDSGFVKIRPAVPGYADICVTDGRERDERHSRPIAALKPCATATPPRTSLEPLGDGRFRIWWNHPEHGIGCLTVIDAAKGPGYRLEPWDDCPDFREFQKFVFEPVDTPVFGGYRIRPLHSGLCVGVAEPVEHNAEVVQEECTGGADQEFLVDPE